MSSVHDLTRALDFSNYTLSTLPEDIVLFSKLERMILDSNSFRKIPDAFLEGNFPIRILSMAYNQIDSLSNMDCSSWKQLEELKLGHNAIPSLPPSINLLQSLQVLELQYNKLTQLPDELCLLQCLELLNISNNQIKAIPVTIADLCCLRSLLADSNEITSFPALPCNIELKILSLRDNPLQLPCKTLNQLIENGIKVTLTINGQESNMKRSASEGSDKADLKSFIEKVDSTNIKPITKAISTTITRKTRTRSRSEAIYPGEFKRRSSLLHAKIPISWQSKPITSKQIDLLPSEIRKSGIEYWVDGGSAAVLAASKEQLIALLTYDSGIDLEKFQKIFLATYTSFMESKDLLHLIFERFTTSTTKIGRRRCIDLISLWIDIQYVSISQDATLKDTLITFLNENLKETFSADLLAIMEKLNDGVSQRPGPRTEGSFWALLKPKEIARHLSTIDHRFLRKIPLHEMIDNQSQQQFGEITAISSFAAWFNTVFNWVCSSIILSDTVQQGCMLITRFILVISRLLELRNYSSAMAMYSALGCGAVQRLAATWKVVPMKYTKYMADYDRIFSIKMNFASYREVLKRAEAIPCIPVFSVLIRDLTHIQQASPTYCARDKLDVCRLHNMATHLIDFRNRQLFAYEMADDRPSYILEQQLRAILPYSKDDLYALAAEKEVRDVTEQQNKRKKRISLRDTCRSLTSGSYLEMSEAEESSTSEMMPSMRTTPVVMKKKKKDRKSSTLPSTTSDTFVSFIAPK